MIIKNGCVFGEDNKFAVRDLYIENGKIVENASQVGDRTEIDAEGLYVLPGLIDVHSHGAVGYTFSDGDVRGIKEILRYECAHGITTYCPTSVAGPKEEITKAFAAGLEAARNPEKGLAHIAGFNMEGPFLDPEKRGAHREDCLMLPDVEFFRQCSSLCGGMIKLVTLAPNVEKAMEFIETLRDEVKISLGHTAADYDTSLRAIAAGANHVTHLHNAMRPFAHRDTGLIGAAADSPDCMVELISDGIHVHESMVRATFRLFPGRVVLISDSIRPLGMKEGTYNDLGGQEVTLKGRKATLSDGTIAGSATNLYDCMCCAVSFGIPLEEAVAAASANPAKSIGIYDQVGSLTPGKRADVLLADRELKLVRVITG